MTKKRGLLGVVILGWVGFCVYLALRGVRTMGTLNYLDSGNVSSILTASAVVSAIVWIRSDLLERKHKERHEELMGQQETHHHALKLHHDMSLDHLRAELREHLLGGPDPDQPTEGNQT